MIGHILFDSRCSRASSCRFLFLWINTHALSNTPFNIGPFFAGAFHASPNAPDAFFFRLTEVVNQTHFVLSSLGGCVPDTPSPISEMPLPAGWKLLARAAAAFYCIAHKPL
jgi:hypothetical protein